MDEDFYEDDFCEDAQPQFDLDLLLSVAGGLGRFVDGENGRRHYEKDEDCIGETICSVFMIAAVIEVSQDLGEL